MNAGSIARCENFDGSLCAAANSANQLECIVGTWIGLRPLSIRSTHPLCILLC